VGATGSCTNGERERRGEERGGRKGREDLRERAVSSAPSRKKEASSPATGYKTRSAAKCSLPFDRGKHHPPAASSSEHCEGEESACPPSRPIKLWSTHKKKRWKTKSSPIGPQYKNVVAILQSCSEATREVSSRVRAWWPCSRPCKPSARAPIVLYAKAVLLELAELPQHFYSRSRAATTSSEHHAPVLAQWLNGR